MTIISWALNEAVTTWHRGSHASNPFELRSDGNSTDQFGGGFYLTNKLETAQEYGKVGSYKINTDATFVTERTRVDATVIDTLMRKSPELDDYLENWDPNPTKAFRLAKANLLEYSKNMLEALKMVEFDMYRDTNPKKWMEACVSVGINGKIVKVSSEEKFLILYNVARAKSVKSESEDPRLAHLSPGVAPLLEFPTSGQVFGFHGTRGGFDDFDFEFSAYPGLETIFVTTSEKLAWNFGPPWKLRLDYRKAVELVWGRGGSSNADLSALAQEFKAMKRSGGDLLILKNFKDVGISSTVFLPAKESQITVLKKA